MKINKHRLMEASVGEIADNVENGELSKNDPKFKQQEKQVAKAMGIPSKKEIMDLDDPTDDIAKELTRSLINAQNQLRGNPDRIPEGCNVLFVGNAGTGKTSRIEDWAEAHGVNLVPLRCVELDETDLGGMKGRQHDDEGKALNVATRITTQELDGLNEPNSVLFLDEVNRARPEVVGSILTLIQHHTITDASQKGRKRKLNFLFTIAAMNPERGGYTVQRIDPALRSRFMRKEVLANKNNAINYLTKLYNKKAKEYLEIGDRDSAFECAGRINLVKALLSSPDFTFDSDAEEDQADDMGFNPLTIRTFANLLAGCDGTKEDFLDRWDYFVNPYKKEMAEDILMSYVDIEDDANNALRYGDAPTEAQREDNEWSKLGLDTE